VSAFIDQHKERFGVEPICRTLEIAPSTYYARRSRPPSARAMRDEQLCAAIRRVHADNYGVYGADKVWAQLNREGIRVARCSVGPCPAEWWEIAEVNLGVHRAA
jgi:putative transposase